MGKKSVSLIAFAVVFGVVGDAMAAVGDNMIVTSKAYVDNKVPAYASGGSASLLTDTDTTGTIAKRAIFTDGTTYVAGTHANQIPTMGAVMSAISSGVSAGIDTLSWTSTETTAANAYSTTFDGTTGNWPAADGAKLINGTALGTALSLKQNIIPAGTNGYLATHSGTAGTFGTPVNPATFQSAIPGTEWQDQHGTEIPGVVVSTSTTGTVEQRMILDKTQGISDSNISNLVTTGYDDGTEDSITFDIHDDSVTAADVNSSVPTTKMTVAIANAAANKNKIPAGTNGYLATHSGTAGTFGTPVNPATFQTVITGHAAGAADSLLTDSATAGTVQKRAIYNDTAANYNSSTQSTYIPTMGAVMSAVSAGVSGADISSHTVNGAPLSNSSSYFYATSSTAAATAQKEVSIPSITSLATGQIIVVQPSVTSTVKDSTIKLNDFTAYPMLYNNAAITTSTDSMVWNAAFPSIWVFDGTYWVFLGRGLDSNTTYTAMSVEEGTGGAATSSRTVRADYLKQIIQGTTLTGLSTADATAVAASDSITTGIGKLQAQITNVNANIPTLPTGTTDSVVTYGANGTFGERGVETSSLGTSTSATTLPTTGVVVSAFNTKFPANGGTNKVVTLSSTAGAPSSRNIVTTLTSGGTNIPTDGAVYSAVDAKQTKAVCTATKPGDSSVCYAYTFADISATQAKSGDLEPIVKQ